MIGFIGSVFKCQLNMNRHFSVNCAYIFNYFSHCLSPCSWGPQIILCRCQKRFVQVLPRVIFWAITEDFERNCCCIIYLFYYFFHTNALYHADSEKGISAGILAECAHLLVYFLIIDIEISGNLSEHRLPKVLYLNNQCLLLWGRFA